MSDDADDDARLALIARTLQVRPEAWQGTVADYRRERPAADAEAGAAPVADRLAALARAYARWSPHAAPLPAAAPEARCPACGGTLAALLARAPGPLVFGRCPGCGHGALLGGGAGAPYRGGGYYEARDARGVGYDDYGREAAYREAKGDRLAARIAAVAAAPIERLLEVGSGFGFTRAAAERRGMRTAGVDLNPHAAAEARRRYGLATFTGTLAEALAAPASGVAPGAFDAVLYQFVLEHVPDVAAELAVAAAALRPGGWLALLVPSMEAAEIDVFGASYRSFRADHLHLFSRASMARLLAAAGLEPRALETACSLHLLRGFLNEAELAALYAAGRGPDLFVVARRPA